MSVLLDASTGLPLAPSQMHPELLRDRRQARASGARLYFPELRCRHSSTPHLAPRRVVDAKCCVCLGEAQAKAKAGEAAKRAAERDRRDARRIRAARAKAEAREREKDAAKAARRAGAEARARAKAQAKAAATRAAKKALVQAQVEALPVVEGGPTVGNDVAPWD